MRTVQGYFEKYIECLNPFKHTWVIRWNKREETNKDLEDREETVIKWEEETFDHKPELSEIKTVIENYFNTEVQEKILSGFAWKDKTVWLTQENQINYKSLYDLQGEVNTIKVGEDEYITFNTFEEYKEFYLAAIKFIKDTLAECWEKKDSFDYTPYAQD
jgi:hypothetical protein